MPVAKLPALTWINLFNVCFEWVHDGGTIQKTKDRAIRTGFYTRKEWPGPGGAIDQFNFIADIFNIIRNEEHRKVAARS